MPPRSTDWAVPAGASPTEAIRLPSRVTLRVQGDSVLRFLLQDREFPRSVVFCLVRMQRTLPKLPEKRSVERAITRTLALLRDADVESLMEKDLTEFLDEVQVGIAGINDALSDAYFKA